MANDHNDIFIQINNAVLDLQSADYHTYQRPLRTLGRLLGHAELEQINSRLTEGLNLDLFLEGQELSGGMNRSVIEFPDDPEEALGLTLLLMQSLAEDPVRLEQYAYFYSTSTKVVSGIRTFVSAVVIPFARDYKAYVLSKGSVQPRLVTPSSNKIFIVHGHDEGALQSLARFLEKLKIEVIVLKEQPNQGRTIIEKYEQYAEEVGFAVVLLTPDDVGASSSANVQQKRARQNVVFELGYFAGKLGRGRVCLLRKGDVEIPSDLFGVVYTDMDEADGWKHHLVKELKAAKLDFDANLVWA